MAGTVTQTFTKIANPYYLEGMIKLELEWACEVAAATIPDTAISAADTAKYLSGRVCVLALTIPDAGTAPTDNYDITIEDEYGVDVMGAVLTNRSSTLKQQVVPLVGDVYAGRICGGAWTFKLANNLVNAAEGKCVLYFV